VLSITPALEAQLRDWLAEDIGRGDLTAPALIGHGGRAHWVSRGHGVFCGGVLVGPLLALLDPFSSVRLLVGDGEPVRAGQRLLELEGQAAALVAAERTALNLCCHLSGVATATAALVADLAGSGVRLADTRKTTPGLRVLEKYAVRCGGGVNHRMGLWDAALVKDNHVVAAGGVAEAFQAVRSTFPGVPVEVEVDSLAQLAEVVEAGADLVLLDNFSPAQTAEAVALVGGRCQLESSGGLSLHVAAAYAATGVDFLAVGALTHSAPVLDLGADLRPVEVTDARSTAREG
jgi:nicotinate-nucleotide pyrophosphorylase (carboxylating)